MLTRCYYGLLHAGACGCLIAAQALGAHARHGLIVPIVAAAVGGAALPAGVALNSGRELNRYLARSAALQLITGASLVVALSM